MNIGIDIGGVIIGGSGEADTSFFTDDFLSTPEIKGAWQAIDDLDMDGHELHIISKCWHTVEAKSLRWLYHNGYFTIPLHRTHFVRERNLKAPMAQALQLDVFIDDREDIIDSMHGIVAHPILFTSWENTLEQIEAITAIRSVAAEAKL